MFTDVITNKKLSEVVTELFIRERKVNISTVFITKTHLSVLKDDRLNCIHFLFWKFQTNQRSKLQLFIHHILTLTL